MTKTKVKIFLVLALVIVMLIFVITGCKKNANAIDNNTSNQQVIDYLQERYQGGTSNQTLITIEDHKVKVLGGRLTSNDETIQITANDMENFGYWKSSDNSIYSTNPTFSISKDSVNSDITLTAMNTLCGFVFITLDDHQNQYSTSALYSFDNVLEDEHTSIAYVTKGENRLQYGIIPIGTKKDGENTLTVFNVILKYRQTENTARQMGIIFEVDGVKQVKFMTPLSGALTLTGVSEEAIRNTFAFRFSMTAIY